MSLSTFSFAFQHLGALMITSQLIGQVTESLIPFIMYKSRVTKVSKKGKKIVMKTADLSNEIERQATQEQYLVRITYSVLGREGLAIYLQSSCSPLQKSKLRSCCIGAQWLTRPGSFVIREFHTARISIVASVACENKKKKRW